MRCRLAGGGEVRGEGKLAELDHFLDQDGLARGLARIDQDLGMPRPGSGVEAEVDGAELHGLAVPEAAIVRRGGVATLFVLESRGAGYRGQGARRDRRLLGRRPGAGADRPRGRRAGGGGRCRPPGRRHQRGRSARPGRRPPVSPAPPRGVTGAHSRDTAGRLADELLARPVSVAILVFTLVVLGLFSLLRLPVALLPSLERPRLEVRLEGRALDRETLVHQVVAPLEKRLLPLPGVAAVSATVDDGRALLRVDGRMAGLDRKADRRDRTAARQPAGRPARAGRHPRGAARRSGRCCAWRSSPTPRAAGRAAGAGRGHHLRRRRPAARAGPAARRRRAAAARRRPPGAAGRAAFRRPRRPRPDRRRAGRPPARQRPAPAFGEVRQGGERRPLLLSQEIGQLEPTSTASAWAKASPCATSPPCGRPPCPTAASPSTATAKRCWSTCSGRPAPTPSCSPAKPAPCWARLAARPAGGALVRCSTTRAGEVAEALGGLGSSLALGLLLGAVVLRLGLGRWRPTLALMVVVPAAIVASFALFYAGGVALDVVSLAGLALASGMLVDSSIVVLEAIASARAAGAADPRREGLRQVALPLLASFVTTTVVFLPLFYLEGLARAFFGAQAFAIASSLGLALLFSLTLTPLLCGRGRRLALGDGGADFGVAGYRRLLAAALARPALCWTAVLLVLAAAVPVLLLLPKTLMPDGLRRHLRGRAGHFARGGDEARRARLEELLRGRRRGHRPAFRRRAGAARARPSKTRRAAAAATGRPSPKRAAAASSFRSPRPPTSKRRRRRSPPPAARCPGSRPASRSGAAPWRPLPTSWAAASRSRCWRPSEARAAHLAEAASAALAAAGLPRRRPPAGRRRQAGPAFRPDPRPRAALRGRTGAGEPARRRGARRAPAARLRRRAAAGRAGRRPARPPAGGGRPGPGAAAPAARRRWPASRKRSRVPWLERRDGRASRLLELRAGLGRQDEVAAILAGVPRAAGERIALVGRSRELVQAFGQLELALGLGLLLVFLTIAAIYESLRLPLAVMAVVPCALAGALFALAAGGATFDVFSFLGLLVLGGLVVSNALVLADRAEAWRRSGLPAGEAVQAAAGRTLPADPDDHRHRPARPPAAGPARRRRLRAAPLAGPGARRRHGLLLAGRAFRAAAPLRRLLRPPRRGDALSEAAARRPGRPLSRLLVALAVLLLGAAAAPRLPLSFEPATLFPELAISLGLPGASGDGERTRLLAELGSAVARSGEVALQSGEVGPASIELTVRYRPGAATGDKAILLESLLGDLRRRLPEGAFLQVYPQGRRSGSAAFVAEVPRADPALLDAVARLPGVAAAYYSGERRPELRIELPAETCFGAGQLAAALAPRRLGRSRGRAATSSSRFRPPLSSRCRSATPTLAQLARFASDPGEPASAARVMGKPAELLVVDRDPAASPLRLESGLRQAMNAAGIPGGGRFLRAESLPLRRLLGRAAFTLAAAALLLAALTWLAFSAEAAAWQLLALPLGLAAALPALYLAGLGLDVLTLPALVLALLLAPLPAALGRRGAGRLGPPPLRGAGGRRLGDRPRSARPARGSTWARRRGFSCSLSRPPRPASCSCRSPARRVPGWPLSPAACSPGRAGAAAAWCWPPPCCSTSPGSSSPAPCGRGPASLRQDLGDLGLSLQLPADLPFAATEKEVERVERHLQGRPGIEHFFVLYGRGEADFFLDLDRALESRARIERTGRQLELQLQTLGLVARAQPMGGADGAPPLRFDDDGELRAVYDWRSRTYRFLLRGRSFDAVVRTADWLRGRLRNNATYWGGSLDLQPAWRPPAASLELETRAGVDRPTVTAAGERLAAVFREGSAVVLPPLPGKNTPLLLRLVPPGRLAPPDGSKDPAPTLEAALTALRGERRRPRPPLQPGRKLHRARAPLAIRALRAADRPDDPHRAGQLGDRPLGHRKSAEEAQPAGRHRPGAARGGASLSSSGCGCSARWPCCRCCSWRSWRCGSIRSGWAWPPCCPAWRRSPRPRRSPGRMPAGSTRPPFSRWPRPSPESCRWPRRPPGPAGGAGRARRPAPTRGSAGAAGGDPRPPPALPAPAAGSAAAPGRGAGPPSSPAPASTPSATRG